MHRPSIFCPLFPGCEERWVSGDATGAMPECTGDPDLKKIDTFQLKSLLPRSYNNEIWRDKGKILSEKELEVKYCEIRS